MGREQRAQKYTHAHACQSMTQEARVYNGGKTASLVGTVRKTEKLQAK